MTSTTGVYDKFVFTDGDELWDRLHQAHRRFAALLSVTPRKHRLRNSDWAAGDVAAHLLNVVQLWTRRDLDDAAGLATSPEGVAALNSTALAGVADCGVPEIIQQLWQELDDLERILPRTTDLHRTYPFHAGQQVDAAGLLGNLIGEFLLHGRDVAISRRKTWLIGSRNAALALNLGVQAVGGYVSPDAPGDLKLEIRTPETSNWILDLAGTDVESRAAEPRERVDVRVLCRPEPLLLNMYGRMSLNRMVLHGAFVVGGRRPWRIRRLPESFETP
ncbi:hypothetical protein ABIE44_003239 [Marmoricola sp. OAE513]|uniref:hypothetical protein n=1 Tax=Marmoricola sp. OAE513 TaxID=2817894 RepID=UPI001AEAF780